MLLPKNTEIRCRFENIPAGFVAQTIVFLTGETAAPMSYDIATGKWIKPEPPVVSTNPPVVSTNPPAVSTNPSAVSTNPPAVSTGSSAVSTGSPGVPKVSPNPRPQKSSNDIVDLLENNILEVEIAGGNITYVNLRVRRLVPEVVNVTIPAGSFFVSDNPAAQNMVATAEKKTRLTTDGWVSISMPAACANRPKDIPDGNDKFRVQRSPNQDELTRLMPALGKSNATILVKQAAVWIVTDDADFDDLGILTTSPGNTRAIWYETTARAMKICAEAGIDITKKRIWRDKETIVSKLSAGELKNWLQNFGVPKTT
jgi:hypothetical protein